VTVKVVDVVPPLVVVVDVMLVWVGAPLLITVAPLPD
jgi:hypothetical protein